MLRRYMDGFGLTLLQDEESDGTGGGSGEPAGDKAANLEGLKAKYGSAQAALAVLYDENHRLRGQRRELREKVTDLEAAHDGATVLTEDDAKAWAAYQELGKPDELKTQLEEAKGLRGKVAKTERTAQVAEAAKLAGWDGKEAVLGQLLGADDKVELREEMVDGEAVKVPYITPAGENQPAMKLTEHAEKAWKEFLPSLQAESGGEGGVEGTKGPEFPQQSPSGKAPRTDPAAKALGGRYKAPSERTANAS